MTKRDFEMIAGILREYRVDNPKLVDQMSETFAIQLANRNAQFNYPRFIAATKG